MRYVSDMFTMAEHIVEVRDCVQPDINSLSLLVFFSFFLSFSPTRFSSEPLIFGSDRERIRRAFLFS